MRVGRSPSLLQLWISARRESARLFRLPGEGWWPRTRCPGSCSRRHVLPSSVKPVARCNRMARRRGAAVSLR
jgi:hypothetical protein